MAEVRWTPQAADDLEAIAQFIANDSPQYASLFVLDVLAAAETLADFPQSGRVVPEARNQSLREILQGSYRIIYSVAGEIVQIVTVYHAARLLDPSRLRGRGLT